MRRMDKFVLELSLKSAMLNWAQFGRGLKTGYWYLQLVKAVEDCRKAKLWHLVNP